MGINPDVMQGEIAAAGLTDVVAWIGGDGSFGCVSESTSEQVANVKAVISAHLAKRTPLALAIEAKRAEINAERDRRYYGVFVHQGSPYDVDAESRNKMNGVTVLMVAGAVPGMTWRDHDNVDHALITAQWMILVGALAVYSQAVYEASWSKKAEVDALPDAEAVAAYDVAAGWPA